MWTTTFNQDTEVEGVGTVVASCDNCTYKRRVDTNDSKDVDAFIAEAKAKDTEATEKKNTFVSVTDSITSKLNQ